MPDVHSEPVATTHTAALIEALGSVTRECIFTIDADGLVTGWTVGAQDAFGYAAGELLGDSWHRLAPEDEPRLDALLPRLAAGERIVNQIVRCRRRDGGPLPVALTASSVRNADLAGAVISVHTELGTQAGERAARRLAAIVDSSDDAIISKNLQGIVQSWNRAAELMLGYSAAEMIGQSIRRIIPADRQSEEDEVLARLGRGEKVDHFETVRQRKDGSLINISLTVSPIRDERGVVIGASKIARDISERKRADEERARLLALAERNASITERLNRVGSIVASTLDREAVVQAVTDAATELTTAQFGAFFYNVANERGESYTLYTISGVPREEFSKFPMPRNTAVFDPTFRGTAVVRSDDITKDPRYGRNPPHYGQPKGHLPVRSYLAVPVRSNTGMVLGGLFFGHSEAGRFTQEHESLAVGVAAWASLALENARLYQSVQEANRLKDEFLATLSHELRTPLNAILGYARMLHSGMLAGDRQPRAIETIERNAESLTQIVEDVLDVSRIVAGKMRLNVQSVEVADVVQRAIDAIQPTADVKGIRIHAVLDPDAGPIAGDPERIQQIAWNLLSNAVKFTPRGGRVQVRVQRSHSTVALIVSDTGIGIVPEFIPHLFERFRQADGGTARTHGGLGLGLSIVRQLVEMHGGSITGESEGPDKGATFTVLLPVMIAKSHFFEAVASPQVSKRSAAMTLPDLTGIRVLAVDDDGDALAMVRDILEAAGATVTTARSAAGAIATLESAPPDVLVADLGMPQVDGFELIKRIRSHHDPAVNAVPAAALTAYARSEERTLALRAGFQMHMAKPINPVELVESVRTLTRGRV